MLLESCIRNCDNFQVLEKDVNNVLGWESNQNAENPVEIAFKPARVILQVGFCENCRHFGVVYIYIEFMQLMVVNSIASRVNYYIHIIWF